MRQLFGQRHGAIAAYSWTIFEVATGNVVRWSHDTGSVFTCMSLTVRFAGARIASDAPPASCLQTKKGRELDVGWQNQCCVVSAIRWWISLRREGGRSHPQWIPHPDRADFIFEKMGFLHILGWESLRALPDRDPHLVNTRGGSAESWHTKECIRTEQPRPSESVTPPVYELH